MSRAGLLVWRGIACALLVLVILSLTESVLPKEEQLVSVESSEKDVAGSSAVESSEKDVAGSSVV